MQIKSYEEKYCDQLTKLILGVQQDEFGVAITLDDQPDLMDIPGHYFDGKGHFWVALQDDVVIGTIAVLFLENGHAAIRKLFTDANFRGKEYQTGQKLLDALEAFCAENGKNAIYLGTTDKFKAAHRFYEKNGYEEINKTDLPEDFHILAVDSKFYRKNVN
ncbi:GNAT family N-acetyltransferase [Listeria aquatica]|uniref:GNAT family acetyltransferase n=1 Tax=Listeria aquatica FSL S10-1188 TaxID=1265818 RepID=W7BFB8_9LIST|nr:GNAT family N-acetyltransferase [Listeria aquatica]EUJ21866.1 GNAT family acetyltransferase [Listeria aquatica FSL S10-1188]